MSEWKKTSCVLCYCNCGLEVITELVRSSKLGEIKKTLDRRATSAGRERTSPISRMTRRG